MRVAWIPAFTTFSGRQGGRKLFIDVDVVPIMAPSPSGGRGSQMHTTWHTMIYLQTCQYVLDKKVTEELNGKSRYVRDLSDKRDARVSYTTR